MEKEIVQINKQEFLGWRFSEEEDLIYLGELAVDTLLGLDNLNMDTIWEETGHIPAHLIKNDLGLDEDEDEITPQDYKVQWL